MFFPPVLKIKSYNRRDKPSWTVSYRENGLLIHAAVLDERSTVKVRCKSSLHHWLGRKNTFAELKHVGAWFRWCEQTGTIAARRQASVSPPCRTTSAESAFEYSFCVCRLKLKNYLENRKEVSLPLFWPCSYLAAHGAERKFSQELWGCSGLVVKLKGFVRINCF